MKLTDYRTLGRSGLIVSPLALGTMTFGAERWGAGEKVSRDLFDTYVAAGGNFLDTADIYSAGQSEDMLGRFVADSGLRDCHQIRLCPWPWHAALERQRRQEYPPRYRGLIDAAENRLHRHVLDACLGSGDAG
ncbi:MAG: aldo/keto reductase [Allorhizobium sp.]